MDELLKIMRQRQSSRIPFDVARKVKKADINKILEAARWTPSAHNMQNFEIVLIDDQSIIKKIRQLESPISIDFVRENYRQLSFSVDELKKKKTGILGTMFPPSWRTPNPRLEDLERESDHDSEERHNQMLPTPLLILVLYNPQHRAPASEGDFLGIMSLGCMMENMWLMANSMGLGFHVLSSLSESLVERKIKKMLKIPDPLMIAISFRVGYPSVKTKSLRVRRDISDFVYTNDYRQLKSV